MQRTKPNILSIWGLTVETALHRDFKFLSYAYSDPVNFYLSFSLYVYGTDKFYLSLLWSLAMMHVIDAVLDSFSDLFRSHR
jgi:hypothetical protein